MLSDRRRPWKDQTPEDLPPLDEGRTLCASPSWSLDGRKLACEISGGAASGIVVYTLDSRTYQKIDEPGRQLVWLKDSQRLLYSAKDGSLRLFDPRSRRSRDVLSIRPEDVASARPTSDNRTSYSSRTGSEGDIHMVAFK